MYTEIANQPFLFGIVIVILLAVLAQTLIFMKHAWDRALELGVDKSMLKKSIGIGFSVSIMPTLPVLVILLTLTPLLGGPLAWYRLSVIGSATFETTYSKLSIAAMGEDLVLNGYHIKSWIAAAWVCTIAGVSNMIWMAVACRPIDRALNRMSDSVDLRWVGILGTSAIMGIMGYLSITETRKVNNRKVFLIAALASCVFSLLIRYVPGFKKLKDWNLCLSLVTGMIAACIIF